MTRAVGYTDSMFSGSITTSGNTQSTPVKCRYVREAIFFLDITAITGNLDVEIYTYDSISENWHLLATFDTKTATGQDEGYIQYSLGEQLSITYTTTGTATFSLNVHLK